MKPNTRTTTTMATNSVSSRLVQRDPLGLAAASSAGRALSPTRPHSSLSPSSTEVPTTVVGGRGATVAIPAACEGAPAVAAAVGEGEVATDVELADAGDAAAKSTEGVL